MTLEELMEIEPCWTPNWRNIDDDGYMFPLGQDEELVPIKS